MATNELAKVISLADHKRQIEIRDTIIDIRRVKGMMSLHFANHLEALSFYEKHLIELRQSGEVIMPFVLLSDVPIFECPPSGANIYVQLPYEDLIGHIEITFRHSQTQETFQPTWVRNKR